MRSCAAAQFGARLDARNVWTATASGPGLYEWIHFGPDWEPALRAASDGTALREMARERSVSSLLEDGVDKIRQGVTSLEEVLRIVGSSASTAL
ncbi:MAG: hypothetical protein M5U15_03965 [Kiritimatiellae bacterium]|nr:hypothetical protein [Kiritimatiellia bacterium]